MRIPVLVLVLSLFSSSVAFAEFKSIRVVIFGHSQTSFFQPSVHPPGTWPTSADQYVEYRKWPHYLTDLLDGELLNYGFGGAQSVHMNAMVDNYLASGPSPTGDSVAHFIMIGPNDGYLQGPVINQPILDATKQTIRDMVEKLVAADAKHIYLMDQSYDHARVPATYVIAFGIANQRGEDVGFWFDFISDLTSGNLANATGQIWDAVSDLQPNVKRISLPDFFPDIEADMAGHGFFPGTYGFCYIRRQVPCLTNEYSGIPSNLEFFVFWDQGHWAPRTHMLFAEAVKEAAQVREYKRGYKFKHNDKY
jgi:phospholipase/lecithinase/hemolysin